LRAYFDTVRHHLLLEKVACRVADDEVMRLLKLILKASGKIGVPQERLFSGKPVGSLPRRWAPI
jgi:RNA-directed DNA polymerase